MKNKMFMVLSLGLALLFSFSLPAQSAVHEGETITLKGDIIEEGEFQISDINSFMSELKGLTGKHYHFKFGETIVVTSGKRFTFPYHISPADAALLTKLKSWDESHYKKSGVVKFDSGGKT